MKKRISILLTCILMLTLMASCGGGNNTSNNGSEKSAASGSEPASSDIGDNKEAPKDASDLLLWLPPFASGGEALDKEFWEKTLAPWAEENNVNLSIEITPWGNYEEKYLTGFSSGMGPDVGYMYQEMFNDFIEMGALETLEDSFTQEEKDNYIHFELGNIKGHQYAIPFIVGNARILYCNMDILNQAGVTELPETWDDLIEIGKKINDANIEGVYSFAQEWADPAIGALNNIYYPYLWQAGGDIYNEEGTKVALTDNDAGVRAAQFLYDLKFTHNILSDETLSLSGEEIRGLFSQGKVAMASMSANRAKDFDDAGINWDFVPSLTDKEKATWVAADALIVNSASKNKEMAVELVKYITSAEVMTDFNKEISPFPPITADEEYNDYDRFKDMYENADYLRTLPVAENSFKVMDTLYKNLQLMMLGDLTPEEAIQKTVEYSNSI